MSRHDGVSCDACLKNNFKGRRYKCLFCFDFDLCSSCYETGATINQHSSAHPMQCILTRQDFDLFHGGEALTSEHPQSLTCPFCGKMGFTERTLQEHVTANHLDTAVEVVCPICASVPGGDPNHVTDDFAAHLTLEHPSGAPRELDVSETGSRHNVRRMPHQGRGLSRGVGRQNMRFGSVNSGLFSSSRSESMDPIAELLSQLSGVRRSTAGPRAQQTDRLPSRRSGLSASSLANGAGLSHATSASNTGAAVTCVPLSGTATAAASAGSSGVAAVASEVAAVGVAANQTPPTAALQAPPSSNAQSAKPQQNQSQFLLARIGDSESNEGDPSKVRSRAAFVQDLLISTLCDMSLGSSFSEAGEEQEAVTEQHRPEEEVPTTQDASTQTSQSLANTPSSPLGFTGGGFPPTKNSSTSSVPPAVASLKMAAKSQQTKLVSPRSSLTLTQVTSPPLPFSHHSNQPPPMSGSGRFLTGSGTVAIPPEAASQPPNSARRKPVRGLDGRTSHHQPPPH